MINTFVQKIWNPISGILPSLFSHQRVKEPNSLMEGEKTLLSGLHDLDPQVITKVHETYYPMVFRYAQYRVGDESVTEDLASEAFIRLLEAIHAGGGPRSSLRGWLMGTISNLVNDYYRQVYQKSDQPLHEDMHATNGDPVSLSEKHNRQKILRLGLSQLTPNQQHVLTLRFGSGCSLAETAEIMAKKPNAIKQLQFRALAALRNKIEAEI